MTEAPNGRVLLDFRDRVAVMTLNDPSRLNPFGVKLRRDIDWAMDLIEGGDARCLMITGAGRAFSSGANLNDPDRAPRDRAAEARGEVKGDLELWYNPFFLRLRDLKMPIVTAINGIAAGVGMSLALAGDIRIAAKSASFLQAFAKIGLVPDGGSSYTLPRLVGLARAMELSMLAERLPAETALSWGLINRVVDDPALPEEAMAMARRLAEGPASLALIRKLYWSSLDNSYEQQMQLEADLQKHAGMTADYTEGVTAFREKRRTNFTGR